MNEISAGSPMLWAIFLTFVLVMLVLDLFVFGANKAHKVSIKEAAIWSFVWFLLAMVFNAGLWCIRRYSHANYHDYAWQLGGAGI